jgi:hypothetical protein
MNDSELVRAREAGGDLDRDVQRFSELQAVFWRSSDAASSPSIYSIAM